MILNTIIGYSAAVLTTVAFLPQVIKIIRYKDTDSISLSTFILFFIGICLWFIYGIMNNDIPIIIANLITGALAFIILVYKIKYDYINNDKRK